MKELEKLINDLISIESKYPNDFELGRNVRLLIKQIKQNENKN